MTGSTSLSLGFGGIGLCRASGSPAESGWLLVREWGNGLLGLL